MSTRGEDIGKKLALLAARGARRMSVIELTGILDADPAMLDEVQLFGLLINHNRGLL